MQNKLLKHICKSPLTIVVMQKVSKKYFSLGPGLSRFLCPSKDINFIRVVILDKGDWSLLHACHPFTLNSNFRIDFKMFDF